MAAHGGPAAPAGGPRGLLPARLPIADADLLAVFFNPDEGGGRPTYLHYGGRAHRRT